MPLERFVGTAVVAAAAVVGAAGNGGAKDVVGGGTSMSLQGESDTERASGVSARTHDVFGSGAVCE